MSYVFSAAAGENFTARLAAIWIVSPVAGLRPSRAARSLTLNLPKPASRDVASRAKLGGDHGKRGVDDVLGLSVSDAGVRCDLLCKLVLGDSMLGACGHAPGR